MPLRVVTIDAGGILNAVGVELISGALFQQYLNPVTGLLITRGFMVGLLRGDYGNFHSANANIYEYLDDMPPRLKSPTGGPLHQIAGMDWPQTPPMDLPTGVRTAQCALELETVLGVQVFAITAWWLGDDDRLILEALVNSPTADATGTHARMWDAIADHPLALRTLLRRLARFPKRQKRRELATDPAPTWGETNA
jgi:hypothetical protein